MILLIDESGFLFELLEETIGGLGVPLFRAKDIPSAKRKLLEASPQLVLSFTQIGNDEEAGYKFCKELQSHPSLSQVPVLLFSDELSDVALRKATESGAKGIAPWPVSGESLKRRLGMLLPELAASSMPPPSTSPSQPSSGTPVDSPKPVAAASSQGVPKPPNSLAPTAPAALASSVHPTAPQAQPQAAPKPPPVAPKVPSTTGSQPPAAVAAAASVQASAVQVGAVQAGAGLAGAVQPPTEFEKKLQIAQQILAKVLYDLKTSHLLQVVDFEDVPRVVSEVTRSVCNSGPSEKDKRGSAPAPASKAAETGAASGSTSVQSSASLTSIDLDQIFGRKKE